MSVLLFVRRLFTRLSGMRRERRAVCAPEMTLFISPIRLHRDVSREGVRFYGVCGSCGAHLAASATLCAECAQGHSRSTPPL